MIGCQWVPNCSAAAAQKQVAASNGEDPSEAFATLGLFARYAFAAGLAVEAGVENLLDEAYATPPRGVAVPGSARRMSRVGERPARRPDAAAGCG